MLLALYTSLSTLYILGAIVTGFSTYIIRSFNNGPFGIGRPGEKTKAIASALVWPGSVLLFLALVLTDYIKHR